MSKISKKLIKKEQLMNKNKLDVLNSYLKNKSVNEICEEFNLNNEFLSKLQLILKTSKRDELLNYAETLEINNPPKSIELKDNYFNIVFVETIKEYEGNIFLNTFKTTTENKSLLHICKLTNQSHLCLLEINGKLCITKISINNLKEVIFYGGVINSSIYVHEKQKNLSIICKNLEDLLVAIKDFFTEMNLTNINIYSSYNFCNLKCFDDGIFNKKFFVEITREDDGKSKLYLTTHEPYGIRNKSSCVRKEYYKELMGTQNFYYSDRAKHPKWFFDPIQLILNPKKQDLNFDQNITKDDILISDTDLWEKEYV